VIRAAVSPATAVGSRIVDLLSGPPSRGGTQSAPTAT
jgi:hypothetical protein